MTQAERDDLRAKAEAVAITDVHDGAAYHSNLNAFISAATPERIVDLLDFLEDGLQQDRMKTAEINILTPANRTLREALEKYADSHSWGWASDAHDHKRSWNRDEPGWTIAEEALKKWKTPVSKE